MVYAVSACKRRLTLSVIETTQVLFLIVEITAGLLTLYFMKLEMHHRQTQAKSD